LLEFGIGVAVLDVPEIDRAVHMRVIYREIRCMCRCEKGVAVDLVVHLHRLQQLMPEPHGH